MARSLSLLTNSRFNAKWRFSVTPSFDVWPLTRKTTPKPPSAMISSAVTTWRPTVQGPPSVACEPELEVVEFPAPEPAPPPREMSGSFRENIFFIFCPDPTGSNSRNWKHKRIFEVGPSYFLMGHSRSTLVGKAPVESCDAHFSICVHDKI